MRTDEPGIRFAMLNSRDPSASVVLADAENASLMGVSELIRDLQLAKQQLENGEGIEHEKAHVQIRARLRR
ncbi:MAG: hypothetical protein HC897_01645 [Thermoanaerobaculia bacterium]|nr:hypothetical protein [Thermoanaerobaculia bacterium]